jgi:DNA-directed RNA polymerase sigma subunit (sigma70/sigma32)
MTTNAPGLSHDQIAEVMGISAARVKQIERHALGKLRRELERRYHVTVEDVQDIIPPDSDTYEFWA